MMLRTLEPPGTWALGTPVPAHSHRFTHKPCPDLGALEQAVLAHILLRTDCKKGVCKDLRAGSQIPGTSAAEVIPTGRWGDQSLPHSFYPSNPTCLLILRLKVLKPVHFSPFSQWCLSRGPQFTMHQPPNFPPSKLSPFNLSSTLLPKGTTF